MPDLRTALETALSKAQTTPAIPAEWDDETTNTSITEVNTMQTQSTDTKRVYFQTTNNVTRETFNYVRDNPGLTRIYVAQALEKQGFKKASTTSLLGQMVKQGLMREHNGHLFTTQSEYTPLKASARLAKTAAKATQPKPKVETKVKRVASTNTLLAEEFDAEKFVDGMTLKQAKAVYDVLSKIFKG